MSLRLDTYIKIILTIIAVSLIGLFIQGLGLFGTEGSSLQTDYQFVGSINSDIYHYPECGSAKKIKPDNLVKFESKVDAEEIGYRPCKVCKPD